MRASRTDRTKASRADRTGASWTLSVDRALATCDLTPQLHTRSQCPEECDSPRGPVQLTITPAPTITARDRGVKPATISQPRASLSITSIVAARSAREARDAAIVESSTYRPRATRMAGPPEATNRTASAFNGSGEHRTEEQEERQGESGRQAERKHMALATEHVRGGTPAGSRQQQAPVHHHQVGGHCCSLSLLKVFVRFDFLFVRTTLLLSAQNRTFRQKNCPPVRVTRTSLRSGFYFWSLTFDT